MFAILGSRSSTRRCEKGDHRTCGRQNELVVVQDVGGRDLAVRRAALRESQGRLDPECAVNHHVR